MRMRRANGTGAVYKLNGRRRRPWAARITIGWEIGDNNTSKQVYKYLGTFRTRIEAETVLDEYLQNPYDLDARRLTFAEVYELWSAEYFPTLKNKSSTRIYIAAFKHCTPIHEKFMRDLRVSHLQGVIRDAETGDATKGRMKSMFNMMYRFALIHEIVDKNYAALFVQKVGKRDKKTRLPFLNSEISTLWQQEHFGVTDIILFNLYSGFRPSETLLLENANVNIDRWVVVGGMKTEAGTDRIVPIHEKVRHIVLRHYNPDNKYLFCNERQEFMTYDQYRGRFKRVMSALKMSHTPHETRHTFISCAKYKHMDDNLLKRIVGHEIRDITETVYTHRPLSDLIDAMELIDYSGKDIPLDSVGCEWD